MLPKLSQETLRLLGQYGVAKSYRKNSLLVSEGDSGDTLFIIVSGGVKVFLSDDSGKEVLLNTLGPDDYFGELALLDAEPRSASVMTLEPTQVIVVSRGDFRQCLAANPELALQLITALVKRVRALTGSVRNLALMDVYGRVANTLLGLATEQDGRLVIKQRLTHQDIASRVGASREMITRIMRDLRAGGYITVQDRIITILGKLPARW